MIFIKPEDNQSIFIAKHNAAEGPFKLILTHNLTGAEHTFNDLKNEGYKSGYWIFINMDFRELSSGEHTYKVFDKDNNQLETGLLQVMYELSEPISYNTEKTTVQYGG